MRVYRQHEKYVTRFLHSSTSSRRWMGRRPIANGVEIAVTYPRQPRKVTSAPKLHVTQALFTMMLHLLGSGVLRSC